MELSEAAELPWRCYGTSRRAMSLQASQGGPGSAVNAEAGGHFKPADVQLEETAQLLGAGRHAWWFKVARPPF